MFELYARISYANRCATEGTILPLTLSLHESKYFSYAGRLYLRCSQLAGKSTLALDSLRNFCCAGLYEDASKVLTARSFPLQDGQTFKQLQSLIYGESDQNRDPLQAFLNDYEEQRDDCKPLINAIAITAKIGCRSLYQRDENGFAAALSLLRQTDRIQFLTTVQEDTNEALSRRPWGSHHLFCDTESTKNKPMVDLTQMLVTELENENRIEEAATILEDRGYLLEAANRYTTLASQNKNLRLNGKAESLRVRFIELMVLCDSLPMHELNSLLASIDVEKLSDDDKCSLLLAKHFFHKNIPGLINVVARSRFNSRNHDARSSACVLWQIRAFELALKLTAKQNILNNLPGKNSLDRLTFMQQDLLKKVKQLVTVLHKGNRTAEENLAVLETETFFDLNPKQFHPSQLETNPIVNARYTNNCLLLPQFMFLVSIVFFVLSRLRQLLLEEKCGLPLSHGTGGGGFKLAVDRDAIHLIISKHLSKKIGVLLMWWSELIMTYKQNIPEYSNSMNKKNSSHDFKKYMDCVQMQLCCLEEISSVLDQAKNQGLPLHDEPWSQLKKIREQRQSIYDQFLHILANERHAFIKIEGHSDYNENEDDIDSHDIALQTHTIQALLKYSQDKFFKTHIRMRRENISHAMTYHRVLSLCKGKQHACKVLDKEINKIERHRETHVYDARKRKMPYCINAKGQVFPRLWLWATESVEEDGKSFFLLFLCIALPYSLTFTNVPIYLYSYECSTCDRANNKNIIQEH